MTAPGDEDIRGLDVAVDDAFAVHRVKCVGNFDGEREHRFGFHRPSGNLVLQRHAVEELHHHEGAALFFPDVAQRADVGMIQRRRGTGLAAEALQDGSGASNIIRQEFEGYEAP